MTEVSPYIKDTIIQFKTGQLSLRQIEAIFSVLPFEVDFIDANDRFIFFSNQATRIHSRTLDQLNSDLAVLHPDAVKPMVAKMITDLRSGTKDKFEIVSGEHHTYNGYFAVRDNDNNYMGTLVFTGQLDYFTNLIENGPSFDQVAKPDTSTGASASYDPTKFEAPKYDKAPHPHKPVEKHPTSSRTVHKDASTGPSDTHWLS